MQDRIDQELTLLRKRHPNLEYRAEDRWVRIPTYPLPTGWNRPSTDVAFLIPVGYPGTPPYGIYVPAGLLFNGSRPDNYSEPAGGTQPPFGGTWGQLSWSPDGPWRATAELTSGSTLVNWVIGFADRFKQGR